MSATAPDRLTADDVQILKLEGGAIRGHTCKVLVLERGSGRPLPSLEELRTHIEGRLDDVPRLRRRLVPTPLRVANPVWLDDPHFDIARHVSPVAAPGAIGRGDLERVVAELMTRRLDRSRPLWQLDVVEQLDDDSMALIWRIHHCLADGTTCVRLMSELLWSETPEQPAEPARRWTPQAPPGQAHLLALGLRARAHALRPEHDRAARQHRSWSGFRSALTRELGPIATPTALAQHIGEERNVALASVPLEGCKRAGKAIAETVTLNDVVLAIIAGAVGTWLGHTVAPSERLRVKVPVSLHHAGEGEAVSNRDSYFFVDLPVGERDVVKRVLAINRETRERKFQHDADVLYRLGHHPLVSQWAMSPRVFTFNVSNVRGPDHDVYVLGARVRELYSLAEVAERHALRVAVISAGDSLFFGLCADQTAVRDLAVMRDAIPRAADELLALIP